MANNRDGVRQAQSFPAAARVVFVESADQNPASFILGAETSIGSAAENNLQLSDPSVSRRHALIKQSGAGYRLIDLGSTNGSFVNGQRVNGAIDLKAGDKIRLGAKDLIFIEPAPPEPPPVTRRARKLSRVLITVMGLALLSFAGTAGVLWYRARTGTAAPRDNEGSSRDSANPGAAPAPARETNAVAPSPAGSEEPVHEGAHPGHVPQWLGRLNYYRALVGEAPVAEDPRLSGADQMHAEYLVTNYKPIIMSGTMGAFAHREDPGKPGYTPQGAAAAARSDVYFGSGGVTTDELIDGWISGPFHRLPMLRPELQSAGFGIYRDAEVWAAAVFLAASDRGARLYGRPVEFPPDGSSVGLEAVRGEWPDPLASCPGYMPPAGLAVTLQLGHLIEPRLGEHSITADGQAIEHCAFDAAGYTNSDPMVEQAGRAVLASYGAIVLIPRGPLTAGVLYHVSITAGGHAYAWSFSVTRPSR